jgi:signal transduction histidine kinase
VSRLPIRLRLTAAFAAAMTAVLVGACLFVYLRLKGDLDESLTAALDSRATAVLVAGTASAGATGEPEEGFAQLLRTDGTVNKVAPLTPAELRRAAAGEVVVVERTVPSIEGTTRVLAKAGGTRIAVVGQSLADRDETLGNVVASFAIGGPVAVILASLLGYALSAAGLRPVDALRARAREVSLSRADERLPLPEAHDEIRRLGETLNEMLDRLGQAFERERRFVADASHELRTPVAVIKTELEGALRRGGHDPQVREALIASLEEADHLAQLAEDLLVVARTGEGALPLRPEPVDVLELLERTRRRFADRAAERARPISVDAEPALGGYADEPRLLQALGNLVDNALRYGSVEIVLRARRDADGVALEVSDQGEGFPAGFAERAFERFTRGDRARTRDGAGLGLAIVRTIAEAHGGRADLAGATVRIWLPNASSGPSKLPVVASGSQETNDSDPGGEAQ